MILNLLGIKIKVSLDPETVDDVKKEVHSLHTKLEAIIEKHRSRIERLSNSMSEYAAQYEKSVRITRERIQEAENAVNTALNMKSVYEKNNTDTKD